MLPCSGAVPAGSSSTHTDLSSWYNSQDLDFLGDPGIDELMPAEPVRVEIDNQERLKEKNRQAQKRTRQRQKVCPCMLAASIQLQHETNRSIAGTIRVDRSSAS